MPSKLMILAAGPEQIHLIRAAGEMGIYTIVVDEDPQRPGMALADEPVNISIMDVESCIELARERQVDGVTTASLGLGMRTVGAVAEALNLPGLRRRSAYWVTDKIAMRQRLAEVGLDDVPFRIAHDVRSAREVIGELGLPVVFKPPDGSGSRGVQVVDSGEHIEQAYTAAVRETRSTDRAGQVLIEKFVDGEELGCDGFIIGDSVKLPSVREKIFTPFPYRQEIGYSYPPGLAEAEQEAVRQQLQQVAFALQLHDTSFNADVKIDASRKPVLIEIGARLPGYGLAHDFVPFATGINLFQVGIELALGHRPDLGVSQKNPTVMHFLQPPPGRISGGIDLDGLRQQPGIICARCDLHPGETITAVTDGRSALHNGYVVATGESVAAARTHAQAAADWFYRQLCYA